MMMHKRPDFPYLDVFQLNRYPDLTFNMKPYNNKITLKHTWNHNHQKTFWSTPDLMEQAVLIDNCGWFQMFYNSIDALEHVICLMPQDLEVKFVALPAQLWETIKNRWSGLHFNNHAVYCLNENVPFSSDFDIVPIAASDVDYIAANQPYLEEYGGKSYLEHRVNCGLTACVRHKGKLIAWEILQDDGSMGFLRVADDFRRQGIGTAVQAYLAEMVLKNGMNPLCHVGLVNKSSANLMEKLNMTVVDHVSWVRKRTPKEIARYEKGVF